MSLEFIPISVRALMIAPGAPEALGGELGKGEEMRVYPIEAPEGAPFPNVVYSQLDERVIATKDGNVPGGWELSVFVNTESGGGGYMTNKRVSRMTRRALDRKVIQFQEDHHEEGEFSNARLRFTGEEELPPSPEKRIITTALTFRATKINTTNG